jgi:CheY-like chemotaxis protein
MTPEVQSKAFEPFFTTKGPGSGSGLGLSQVFGTARQSGGDVKIESTPGKGTTVSVFLPRAAIGVRRPAARPVESLEQRTSQALVLAVDDDEAVRHTTADILKGLGYGVLQAANGEAALALLNQNAMIDVLLTDVVMPGMSGPELARRARSSHPRLPIVFISGYADPEGIAGDVISYPLVKKPFRPSDLRRQVEAALAQLRAPAV